MEKSTSKRILVVDDDETIRRSAAYLLKKAGYLVDTACDGEEALIKLQAFHPTIILLDLRMPKLSGLEVIDQAIEINPDLAIVVMTAHGTIKVAVDALQRGAFDFVTKPFEKDRLLSVASRASRFHNLVHENRSLRRIVNTNSASNKVIAVSKLMREVLERVLVVAPTPSNILLLGESGTGKELLAQTIHSNSLVASGPFHAVNIAAVPKDFFESVLFGHRRGSFTGAFENRAGAFETAKAGTLFLDEIGDLSKQAQVKLLRVLQEREFTKLGEDKARPLNVRLIAATNCDLNKEIAAGNFREDLYYRLCVVPVQLPPLRQRREDIPALSARFLERAARRLKRPIPKLSSDALTTLCSYDFPGNIRELENLMERLVALNPRSPIAAEELNLNVEKSNLAKLVFDTFPIGIDLQAHEKDLIQESLQRCQGNQTKAARLLGITRSALIYRMEKYKIPRKSEK